VKAFLEWLDRPQSADRLRFLRVAVPLVVLGFLSARLIHADEWLSTIGFQVPRMKDGDYRQPLYLAPVVPWLAWTIAGALVAAGLALAAGLRPRVTSVIFAALLVYVALADRLEAFTVSKLAPVLVLALGLAPGGLPWRAPPALVPGGALRFFQIFLPVMYSGSGIAKARGDWLTRDVVFSHLHDSYQTDITYFLIQHVPAIGWVVLQMGTLAFEVGAPLWFALRWTRTPAFFVGASMHVMIGLLFGPVIWFALLMIALLVGGYAPERLFPAPPPPELRPAPPPRTRSR
jgi:hypothetical protein